MVYQSGSIDDKPLKKLTDDTLISIRFQGVNTCLTKSENGTEE